MEECKTVCFGKVIHDLSDSKAFLALGVSSNTFDHLDGLITVHYRHVYASVELEGGVFDAHSLENTPSFSSNEGIVVTDNIDESIKTESSLEFAVEGGSKGGKIKGSTGEKEVRGSAKGRGTQRTVDDLRISLNKAGENHSEWKIHQVNNDPLAIRPSHGIEIGTIKSVDDAVSISGKLRTDRSGYEICRGDLGPIETLNPRLRFQLLVFEAQLKKHLKIPISLDSQSI